MEPLKVRQMSVHELFFLAPSYQHQWVQCLLSRSPYNYRPAGDENRRVANSKFIDSINWGAANKYLAEFGKEVSFLRLFQDETAFVEEDWECLEMLADAVGLLPKVEPFKDKDYEEIFE